MILPTGAIHLLDRLKFRFKEDDQIDERLLDDFLRADSTAEAVFFVLSHLKSSLGAMHAMIWKKTEPDRYEFFASADESFPSEPILWGAMTKPMGIRRIRHEPLSKDWQSTQESLFGTANEEMTAIDAIHETHFCLIVAWSDAIPIGVSLEAEIMLLQASFDLDLVPEPLRRSVRTPYGKTYLLGPILALHRLHDPETLKHQEEAASLTDRILPQQPELAERVKTLLWIKNVGAILTPKRILLKSKRSKEENELLLETIGGTRDLLVLFHLEESLLLLSTVEANDEPFLLPEDVAMAEAAWRLTDRKVSPLRPKLPPSLIRRFPSSIRHRIKHRRLD